MIRTEQDAFKQFLIARIEVALKRLRNNPAYMERHQQQRNSEKRVQKLLHKLNKHDRTIIRRHYEGEMVKQNFALDETYLQGMRDCLELFSMLNAFNRNVQFHE